MRDGKNVTFPLAPMYAKKGIRFINEAAVKIDPSAHTITTATGDELNYDRLFLGTGPRLAFERIAGLGPETGFTQSVCNLEHALGTKQAWQRFLKSPGPVVIGTAQGGSCFGASYEFLLNTHHQIKKAGLKDRAPVTFITAEPFLGHFGLGGVGESQKLIEKFLQRSGIEGLANTAIKEVRDGEIELDSGRTLPFAFSMIVPPFAGVDAVTQAEGLTNPAGFIPVDDGYRHTTYEDVYSAGVAIAIAPPAPTPVPAGVPKTGQMTEAMAKVAAQNIAADIEGTSPATLPLGELSAMCILDGGNNGVIFKADRVLSTNGSSAHARTSAGPHAHLAKIAFEQVFLGSRKRGRMLL
jgi:sulfide:quinone oxidoreductase